MAEAKREGGLYYTAQGLAVDADGKEVKDAPKREPNTSPEEMERVSQSNDPVQRLADTLDRTFGGGAHAAAMASMARPKTTPTKEEKPAAPTAGKTTP